MGIGVSPTRLRRGNAKWSFAMIFFTNSKWGCNIDPIQAQHRNLKKDTHSTRSEIWRPVFIGFFAGYPGTWRIIPVSKWLVTPIYKPFKPFGRGITRSLGDVTITMVLNHLQVMGWSSKYPFFLNGETSSVFSVYLVGGWTNPLFPQGSGWK